jgi:hypothetical protein
VNDRIFLSDATSELAPRLIKTFRAMFAAREIDRLESDLVRQETVFFHASGAGGEATATLARHLGPNDWLHWHYRDKALLLARGVPVDEFFSSLVAGGDSHSAGRQMSAHFSAPTPKVLSFVGPVGNDALQAVGIAAAVVSTPSRPTRSIPAGSAGSTKTPSVSWKPTCAADCETPARRSAWTTFSDPRRRQACAINAWLVKDSQP